MVPRALVSEDVNACSLLLRKGHVPPGRLLPRLLHCVAIKARRTPYRNVALAHRARIFAQTLYTDMYSRASACHPRACSGNWYMVIIIDDTTSRVSSVLFTQHRRHCAPSPLLIWYIILSSHHDI